MDELQQMMETQVHLTDPDKVCELIDKVSLYWAHLQDEDIKKSNCFEVKNVYNNHFDQRLWKQYLFR